MFNIMSASYKEDIPCFKTKQFLSELNDGKYENYDFIVFWTKNNNFTIDELKLINSKIPFYFTFTINGYEEDIEPFKKNISINKLIEKFISISTNFNHNYVVWRYDPILINEKYTINWHCNNFDLIYNKLKNYTNTCVINFIDMYGKLNNVKHLFREPNIEEINIFGKHISKYINYNFKIKTCAENLNLNNFGIQKNACIDKQRIIEVKEIRGFNPYLEAILPAHNRKYCNCLSSIDIGKYHQCENNCIYCYAK